MGLTVYGGGGKPEEEKTVTAGTSVIEVNPSSGKAMKKVTVNPTPTESKSVTPTTSELTVTPSEGKHLSQVVVGAVEDVTPEVTAQTPVITQIAENLGVTITTPSGTNKQILQGNNTNLLNIKNNAKKEGLYVWKKLIAEGGDFVDFVVSDSPTAYPDGGEQGGYWYEKFQLDPTLLGYTKYAVDKFTSATKISDSVSSTTVYFPHSLGVIPSLVILLAEEYSIGSSAKDYPCKDGYAVCDGESTIYAVFRGYNSNNAVKQSSQNNWRAKYDSIGFRFNSGSYPYIPAGIEYTLITMA